MEELEAFYKKLNKSRKKSNSEFKKIFDMTMIGVIILSVILGYYIMNTSTISVAAREHLAYAIYEEIEEPRTFFAPFWMSIVFIFFWLYYKLAKPHSFLSLSIPLLLTLTVQAIIIVANAWDPYYGFAPRGINSPLPVDIVQIAIIMSVFPYFFGAFFAGVIWISWKIFLTNNKRKIKCLQRKTRNEKIKLGEDKAKKSTVFRLADVAKFGEAYSVAQQIENKNIKHETMNYTNQRYKTILSEILPFLSSLEDKGVDITEYTSFMEKAEQGRYYKGAEKPLNEIMSMIREKEKIVGEIKNISKK